MFDNKYQFFLYINTNNEGVKSSTLIPLMYTTVDMLGRYMYNFYEILL